MERVKHAHKHRWYREAASGAAVHPQQSVGMQAQAPGTATKIHREVSPGCTSGLGMVQRCRGKDEEPGQDLGTECQWDGRHAWMNCWWISGQFQQ